MKTSEEEPNYLLTDPVIQIERDEYRALKSEVAALLVLLTRCRPVIESEMALMDSMARHMAGGFPDKDVQSADESADFHWALLRDIDAALAKEGK